MGNLEETLANCSPEKRALLLKLLAKREGGATAGPAAPASAAAAADAAAPEVAFAPDTAVHHWGWADLTPKETTARLYDEYHERCNATVFGKHSFFMNLGYAYLPDYPRLSPIHLPAHTINRNSMQLVLEMIGDFDLNGCDVLDVGCGRGGIIHTIHTHYQPKSTWGLDLAPQGVAFCQRTHRYPNARFVQGDAEHLPFADASFDAVTNVESSHSYPDIHAFYREVCRVLRPGGCFLYTDILPVTRLPEFRGTWEQMGLTIERDIDISPNVLASCDESASLQYAAFAKDDHDHSMANALGVPGSDVYEHMKNKTSQFRIFRLRKRP